MFWSFLSKVTHLQLEAEKESIAKGIQQRGLAT